MRAWPHTNAAICKHSASGLGFFQLRRSWSSCIREVCTAIFFVFFEEFGFRVRTRHCSSLRPTNIERVFLSFFILAFLSLRLLAEFSLEFRLGLEMATSAPKHQLLPWTTAQLVPEALRHSLHVVEDPALMKLLGRSKFVDMVVFGASGWQPGVSHLLHFVFFVHTASFSMLSFKSVAIQPHVSWFWAFFFQNAIS